MPEGFVGVDGANRRLVIAGGLSLGLTGASHATPPPVRPDLYNGELDDLALQWKGKPEAIPSRIRIAAKSEPGEPMSISGRCLSWDTGQPVAGVIVYAYHTDNTGSYKGGPKGTRHARLHGWMRTGADGVYTFDSIKPGIYPSRSDPSHVHLTVVEPGKPPYWIDEIVFEGQYGVDAAYHAKMKNRGGSGIIPLKRSNGVWTGVRDIVLERHPA
jgi:protocatechuate 3,4-dioxygenase beta subunit